MKLPKFKDYRIAIAVAWGVFIISFFSIDYTKSVEFAIGFGVVALIALLVILSKIK